MRVGWVSLLASTAALCAAGGLSVSSVPQPTQAHGDTPPLLIRRVSPSIYSGPTPVGIPAMRVFKRLGIHTMVSVDGAPPDVVSAEAVGLHYVHLPSTYDGVSPQVIAGLTRVMRERTAPVYVHCHHGEHRGPASAAICAMIADGISHERAVAFLETAGTSPDYPGLWKSVREFQPLPADAPLPDLVPLAEVEPLVDTMVRIDTRFDELKELLQGEGTLSEGDRASFHRQATSVAHLLNQEFREAARLSKADRPAAFIERLETSAHQSEAIARELEQRPSAMPPSVAVLRQSCNQCHQRFRN